MVRRASLGLPLALVLAVGCAEAETQRLGSQSLSNGGCDARSGEVALHWAPGHECIPVRYDPVFEAYEADIADALDTWASLDCSGLCFGRPIAERFAPTAGPRGVIYLSGELRVGETTVRTLLTTRTETNQILSASAVVDPEALEAADDELRVAIWTNAIANAIGLPSAALGERSVRSNWVDDLALTPTEDDIAAYCSVYGEGGVCTIDP